MEMPDDIIETLIYTHNIEVPVYGVLEDRLCKTLPVDGTPKKVAKDFVLRTTVNRGGGLSLFIPKGATLRVVRAPSHISNGFDVMVRETVKGEERFRSFDEDNLYDEDDLKLDCWRDSLA